MVLLRMSKTNHQIDLLSSTELLQHLIKQLSTRNHKSSCFRIEDPDTERLKFVEALMNGKFATR